VAINAFTFSIWFARSADKIVAWTANRDAPVNGKGSKLTSWKIGALALLDYDGTEVWSTNTTATRADRANASRHRQPCGHGSRRPAPLEELRLADRHAPAIATDDPEHKVSVCICQGFALFRFLHLLLQQ
jgi:hypothetical protein